jgi:hypothetical protein
VIQNTTVIKAVPNQVCCNCKHIYKCRSRRTTSGKVLSDRNDTINLLVCRLKIDINIDQSATSLLKLFRPGMINLVADAKRRANGVNVDFDEMLAEMQSFTIESIMTKYRIGELNPITNFLFDIKSGYLVKWSRWYVTKLRRFYGRHVLSGYGQNEDEFEFSDDGDGGHTVGDAVWDSSAEESIMAFQARAQHTLSDDVNSIIEDSITLNTNEYRAIKFCLQNANDSNDVRMIDGLHIQLARLMGVSRPRVTRLYKRGKDKLTAAINRKRFHEKQKEADEEARNQIG